jgi:hypothetical protein
MLLAIDVPNVNGVLPFEFIFKTPLIFKGIYNEYNGTQINVSKNHIVIGNIVQKQMKGRINAYKKRKQMLFTTVNALPS